MSSRGNCVGITLDGINLNHLYKECKRLGESEVGGDSNREIVSFRSVAFRSCVSACARSGCLVTPISKDRALLCPAELSLSPSPPILLSNFSWVYR